MNSVKLVANFSMTLFTDDLAIIHCLKLIKTLFKTFSFNGVTHYSWGYARSNLFQKASKLLDICCLQ